jgi:hypothetical protein
MMTSYTLEQHCREYRDVRLAEALQERIVATIHGAPKQERAMIAVTLRYARYALSTLASIGFGAVN